MSVNALVVHGGAPTAVMNASLYGAVCQAKEQGGIDRFYAAIGGLKAVLQERFLDLFTVPREKMELLPYSPASAIGTSRDPMEREDYEAVARVIARYNIRYVFFNGGNGSMDACGKTYHACCTLGVDVRVVGIPKTIDNDLSVTDHAPGYGSAARYLAHTTKEICQDVRALPIHVCVIEAMGRNAGWLTAASALARDGSGSGPDFIYVPEHPFQEEEFLEDVLRVHREKGGVVVVVSEGLRGADNMPIVDPVFQTGRAVYYGDVSAHLANLVIRRLGIKARSEKPGICGRASIALQSAVDREEAIMAGREAVRAALSGATGVMVGFMRDPGESYRCSTALIPIEKVMLEEKVLPDAFISASGNDVTDAFVQWCRPLIGDPLPEFVSFN